MHNKKLMRLMLSRGIEASEICYHLGIFSESLGLVLVGNNNLSCCELSKLMKAFNLSVNDWYQLGK